MLVELIAKNAGQTQEERGAYAPRPSSVGRCIRALVYHASGVEPDPFPDRALLVFEDGNWAEELIKDHIRKTVFELTEWKGKDQRIEIAVIDGRVMSGEIDGLLTDPLNETLLLEIKSINHFGFERLKDAPLDDHRRQANLYLHGLNKAGMAIRKALILYKNKNTAAMKEFIIEYDEALALSDIAMFEEVARMAAAGEVPPRPYWFDSWQCDYCCWQDHCWQGYVNEVDALSTDVALSEEIETAARFYNELGAQRSEIEKQRDEIGVQLRKALADAFAQSGKAGEYILTVKATEREVVDKALVPPEAIKKVPSERFTVRKIKARDQRRKTDEVHTNQN